MWLFLSFLSNKQISPAHPEALPSPGRPSQSNVYTTCKMDIEDQVVKTYTYNFENKKLNVF